MVNICDQALKKAKTEKYDPAVHTMGALSQLGHHFAKMGREKRHIPLPDFKAAAVAASLTKRAPWIFNNV